LKTTMMYLVVLLTARPSQVPCRYTLK